MSLLEPPVEKPQKSRVMLFTVAALAFTLAVVLWFTFRYYPEKKAAANFFDALVAGDTNKAYELWKPSATYRLSDFAADWGPGGYYGPVKSYKIMGAKAPKKSDSIEVDVAISPFSPMPDASDGEKSRKTRVVPLWILPSDKSISFPP
ncbi:MAG TPA: hypothetical protein VG075_11770 [Candidatus Acidoferrum sp.]|jgi:hypothetical protein|nr:hypothetical protein [Candidatus Acidoferrum sp.]